MHSREKTKILVVEDAQSLLATTSILEDMDVEILCASSGAEALSAAKGNHLALILLEDGGRTF